MKAFEGHSVLEECAGHSLETLQLGACASRSLLQLWISCGFGAEVLTTKGRRRLEDELGWRASGGAGTGTIGRSEPNHKAGDMAVSINYNPSSGLPLNKSRLFGVYVGALDF